MSEPPQQKPDGYAGNASPAEAYAAIVADPEAVLVDCRTRAEWHYVGMPDLADVERMVLFIEWEDYPAGTVDPEFVDRLIEAGVPRHVPVYFLCRSGVRSKSAAIAATEAAFQAAYNVSDGFEGPIGPDGTRDVSGWKVAELPWRAT